MENKPAINKSFFGDICVPGKEDAFNLEHVRFVFGISIKAEKPLASLIPFIAEDVTVGAENELQTVVVGNKDNVDLPVMIKNSNYFKNVLKRAASGDTSSKVLTAIEQFLEDNPANVWENSWVSFPRSALSLYGMNVLERDLLEDKKIWTGPKRKDVDRFCFTRAGVAFIRVPVSYLLKLSLADSIGSPCVNSLIRNTGENFMGHFLNDNTSPETFSFYPALLTVNNNMGKAVAKETLLRYLLCQFLTEYANRKFGLLSSGQRAMVYFAPNPPVRQKRLNDLVSDCFYRYLFMSPCLSGWDCGEEKHEYMQLCHQVLSRSQLNAVSKLRDAGIITNNLVVLPNLSNTCLANNGTHISLGSLKLAKMLKDPMSGFGKHHEKYMGDLVIKIVEHFLPLFVGTYSAAPYRLAFTDFHPERALGFLPHELDFTHLRMIWRRWKKKAHLKFCGRPLTPFGPELLDKTISKIFGLKGDFITDYRLIDYLVSLMSTDQSPGLDGKLDNDLRLKDDLAALGVFDTRMPIYLLYRMRQYSHMGYSGFEGRHYSLFRDILSDMGHAVNLQVLVTALAYKYILQGRYHHCHIPDDPSTESERRQVFFCSAIGTPTFFVNKNTRNHLMNNIMKRTCQTRSSRRYHGYLRVYNMEYRKALICILKEDGADLIELMQMSETLKDLEARLENTDVKSTGEKLTRDILEQSGEKNPLKIEAQEFNQMAEKYYRTRLKKEHTLEAIEVMQEIISEICKNGPGQKEFQDVTRSIFGKMDLRSFFSQAKKDFIRETITTEDLIRFIHLSLLIIHLKRQKESK